MKRTYVFFIVLFTLITLFYLDARISNGIEAIELQIGLTSAEAKVQDWCKSGRKDADEWWQFNWQTGTYVCNCVSEKDDCCLC